MHVAVQVVLGTQLAGVSELSGFKHTGEPNGQAAITPDEQPKVKPGQQEAVPLEHTGEHCNPDELPLLELDDVLPLLDELLELDDELPLLDELLELDDVLPLLDELLELDDELPPELDVLLVVEPPPPPPEVVPDELTPLDELLPPLLDELFKHELFKCTDTFTPAAFANAKSFNPSPLKLSDTTPCGLLSPANVTALWNVPFPFPSNTEKSLLPALAITKSIFESPFKSLLAIALGVVPTA